MKASTLVAKPSVPHQALVQRSIGIGLVLDDPTPTLTVGAGAATEGDGLGASRSGCPGRATRGSRSSVSCRTAPPDWAPISCPSSTTVNVTPSASLSGSSSRAPGIEGSMSVALLDDAVPEPDETFSVNILEVFEPERATNGRGDHHRRRLTTCRMPRLPCDPPSTTVPVALHTPNQACASGPRRHRADVTSGSISRMMSPRGKSRRAGRRLRGVSGFERRCAD